jgi:hypothetical protein
MCNELVYKHVRCPKCNNHPPRSKQWTCVSCKHKIDPFVLGICLVCEKDVKDLQCTFCKFTFKLIDWYF